MKFPFYKQYDAMDCGPTCLRMISAFHGKKYSIELLRQRCQISRSGVNFVGISKAAESIGFRTLAVKVNLDKLVEHAPLPCILHWNQNHFIVLYKVQNKKYYIADPGSGVYKIDEEAFVHSWQGESKQGVAMLLEPTPDFHIPTEVAFEQSKSHGIRYIVGYLKPYKRYFFQLLLSLLAGTVISLILPFLTRGLVDIGINKHDIGFVQIILISQLVLFVGNMTIEVIRSWLLLHVNTRINIAIISDFLIKLMKLPISYFDSKRVGDIKQRIGDHSRVQAFLTGSALTTFFSLFNLVVFTIVLAYFSIKVLFVFLFFSVLGIAWIVLFLKKRKQLDYLRFQNASSNENVLFELVSAMQEIKLNNCETKKRWGWERVQAKIFQLSTKGLALSQVQGIGSNFFNQIKNIVISYISASEVVRGNITLGTMISISYIAGQLNSPFQQLLGFIQSAQDAKISLDRLSEVHNLENEEKPHHVIPNDLFCSKDVRGITLSNVSFKYDIHSEKFTLKDISLTIPKGKVTAIVGMSGSGKTTLMKLLLKYYEPNSGSITVDGIDLKNLSPKWWRDQCGTVTQEGYLFNDTIANNIALSDTEPDNQKLNIAIRTANIGDFISELPQGYNTSIGYDGLGLSAGQKQRLLISRAVYKNPPYLFFDEATNTLDANNESVILKNLDEFFDNRTVVVIAHRLSTVKNADQIIVLEHGTIVESGTHYSLLALQGKYHQLVRNQLEINSSENT